MRGERVLVNQIRELMESQAIQYPRTVYQDEAPYQEEIAALLTELRLAPPELTEPAAVDPMPADACDRRAAASGETPRGGYWPRSCPASPSSPWSQP